MIMVIINRLPRFSSETDNSDCTASEIMIMGVGNRAAVAYFSPNSRFHEPPRRLHAVGNKKGRARAPFSHPFRKEGVCSPYRPRQTGSSGMIFSLFSTRERLPISPFSLSRERRAQTAPILAVDVAVFSERGKKNSFLLEESGGEVGRNEQRQVREKDPIVGQGLGNRRSEHFRTLILLPIPEDCC